MVLTLEHQTSPILLTPWQVLTSKLLSSFFHCVQVLVNLYIRILILDQSFLLAFQIVVAFVSIFCIMILSSTYGFDGIWVALTIYMALRTFAGFWR